MTRQEKKNILYRYNSLCERIKEIEERLEEIRTAGEKITQSFSADGSAPSGNSSKVERAAVKVPELEEKLRKYRKRKEKIEAGVNNLRSNQRELIRMVYFDNVSQNRAAQILHKTPSSIRLTINRAIDDIAW